MPGIHTSYLIILPQESKPVAVNPEIPYPLFSLHSQTWDMQKGIFKHRLSSR
jgi:hypothetical protein